MEFWTASGAVGMKVGCWVTGVLAVEGNQGSVAGREEKWAEVWSVFYDYHYYH